MQVLASKAQTHISLLSGSELAREISLESGYRSDGIATYLKMRSRAEEQGDGALLKPAERMIQHWFEPVECLIARKVEESGSGYFVGSAICAATLRLLPSEVMAALVMRDCVGLLLQGKHSYGVPLYTAAYTVGRSVLAEYNLKQIKAMDTDDAQEAARILTQHIRRLDPRKIQWWAKRTLEDPQVDRGACLHTGAALIECLIHGASSDSYEEVFSPAFALKIRNRGKQKTRMLLMSRDTKRRIEDGHTVRKLLRPRYGPMVVTPFPWSPQHEGGYATLRTPLISFVGIRQKHAITEADMGRVHGALNAMAATPWRVNERILAVAQRIWEDGGNRLGLPPLRDRPIPPPPPGFNPNGETVAERWSGCTKDERVRWKAQAADMHTHNHKVASSRTEWICKLDMAERFRHERRLFFPHQLDFRGRSYPIPLFLNHQGDDICRGLLEFADPVPPDTRRLAIHAANCYGIDKVPYASREEWTRQHAKDIVLCASDPIANEFWHKADKPWQFLAACYALDDPEAGSCCPTQWDGSCNGLQHYSAMTRDEIGGALVNLVPGEIPADVYSTVCIPARESVEADARAGHKYAAIVLPMVVRKVVKQPVMTQTYGVTMVGAKRQILNQLREMGLEGDDLYKCSQYLANKVMGSIADLCPGATAAMKCLRGWAKTITDAGRIVEWTTPMGLPVVQNYVRRGKQEVNTTLGIMYVRKDLSQTTPKAGKQIQSFPPNFVHSIDACHMMETAVACRSRGVEFAAVHDSYWTHAGTADEMNEILRSEFVRLHEDNQLGRLWDQFCMRHPGLEFAAPPLPGSLDLSLAAQSKYIFH